VNTAVIRADVRTQLGSLYARAGLLAEAVAQYDKWITAHDQDTRVPAAFLDGRGLVRLRMRDLGKSIADDDAVLRLQLTR